MESKNRVILFGIVNFKIKKKLVGVQYLYIVLIMINKLRVNLRVILLVKFNFN